MMMARTASGRGTAARIRARDSRVARVALTPTVRRYDHLLLDLDGCLWVGDEVVDGAVEAVAALREAGKALLFVTNDSWHAPEELVRRLWRHGFQAALDEVLTAGAALQYWLAQRGGGGAYVIGSQAGVGHLAGAGPRVVHPAPVFPPPGPGAVASPHPVR